MSAVAWLAGRPHLVGLDAAAQGEQVGVVANLAQHVDARERVLPPRQDLHGRSACQRR